MEQFSNKISAKDVVNFVAGRLSEVYDIPFVLDDTTSFGGSGVSIDPYSMEPAYVSIGCAPSGRSFECDVCSGVIAVYHEFRHVAQLMCIQDDALRLSGLSNRGTTIVSTSFAAVQPYVGSDDIDYYEKNYRILPYEIDAERFGTKFGMRWIEESFGKDFLRKGMKDRFSGILEDKYPGSLSIGKLVSGSEFGMSEMFKLYFGINVLPISSGRFRDLLDINVKNGVTSSFVAESLGARNIKYGGKDISYIGDFETESLDLSEYMYDEFD